MNHYHQSVKARTLVPTILLVLAGLAPTAVLAQVAPVSPPPRASAAAASSPSNLDALLFYQLLIGELELQSGRPAVALEVLLDAARRSRDEQLYQRAVEIALQARAGDQALSAVRAWRTALPTSTQALRYQVQILGALGRPAQAAEPIRAWLALATPAERLGILAGLPRIFVRGTESQAAAKMIEEVTAPLAVSQEPGGLREAALVTAGRAWMLAGDDNKALSLAQKASQLDAKAPGPLLLALELLPRLPAADTLLTQGLQDLGVEPAVRLAYSRALTQQQRLGEAVTQLQIVTQQRPEQAEPWLTLGAVELELRHPQQAEAALTRYLELAGKAAEGPSADSDARDSVVQARLMLAQAAETRKDFVAAEKQLALIDNPERATDVQTRRAAILVKQGRWREARDLVRALPAATPQQSRGRVLAEVQVLREARRWSDAQAVLAKALEGAPQDVDLIYEQAMVVEKLNRLDEMERLLRRVMELKPDHQHAYNALGYSLADRGLRLDEATGLIQKALALAPGDPFITDSLAWAKFRQGQNQEALRLLRQAYLARPDTEIAAHLGEVLWVSGERDEARRIWNEGRRRDADNEVLQETLKRLQPGL